MALLERYGAARRMLGPEQICHPEIAALAALLPETHALCSHLHASRGSKARAAAARGSTGSASLAQGEGSTCHGAGRGGGGEGRDRVVKLRNESRGMVPDAPVSAAELTCPAEVLAWCARQPRGMTLRDMVALFMLDADALTRPLQSRCRHPRDAVTPLSPLRHGWFDPPLLMAYGITGADLMSLFPGFGIDRLAELSPSEMELGMLGLNAVTLTLTFGMCARHLPAMALSLREWTRLGMTRELLMRKLQLGRDVVIELCAVTRPLSVRWDYQQFIELGVTHDDCRRAGFSWHSPM